MSEPPSPLKITIATVTYNAARLIGRTIRSVEEQNYPSVEHLIIDGNSQDGTLEAVHHYQERNSRAAVPHEVNCLSEPDEGLYDAMNKAIDMASGDYILFLNAGDVLHGATTLADMAAAATGGDGLPAVVYGDTHIVDEAGRFVRRRRLSPPKRLTWKSFRQGMLVCHQAFMARADLAKARPYDLRYRFSADFDWCIGIMREARRRRLALKNAGIVVADYLNEGMTTRNHRASLQERFRIMVRHYGPITTVVMHGWFVVRGLLKK